ncbi:phosphotransferase [Curtobacterium sp. MCBD17_040]|uniref:phosphotransferase n=1 Tax=Curtobacterium sp. MCBD17_040 TaxID=2175674 RepID=UPI000DA95C25|nr:phosphotransferase [Curtobacterium sp. MCBD17_040]WIB65785.1 phosphotransferase [Curtobacterium sp. MCBD17_040]
MIDDEVPLAGGNASEGVVRVGDTVRKPASPSSTSVSRFTAFLRARGVDVPAARGFDEHGRQVLEYVPGSLAMDVGPLDEAGLRRAGALVRRIHDASSEYSDDQAVWDVLIPAPGRPDLLCHNDLAPWNLVVGERWVFIDWDGAGPSTRLWDLAYAAQSFPMLDQSRPVPEAAERLRWFIDGYGADEALRADIPTAMAERSGAMHSLLQPAHADGWEPWATMYTTGHGEYWASTAAYLRANRDQWLDALRSQ